MIVDRLPDLDRLFFPARRCRHATLKPVNSFTISVTRSVLQRSAASLTCPLVENRCGAMDCQSEIQIRSSSSGNRPASPKLRCSSSGSLSARGFRRSTS